MKLLYGLGNPDAENENSRHNVGWMVVDRFRDGCGMAFAPWLTDSQLEVSTSVSIASSESVVLCKPTRYMNDQGACLANVVVGCNLAVDRELLVIHDDLDLSLGELRLKAHGSPPSHNGLKSIRESIATDVFWRLRIGIETRPDKRAIPGMDFVLGDFSAQEFDRLEPILDRTIDILMYWLNGKYQKAINLTKQV